MHLSTLKKRLRLISFGETVGDVKVEALLNTLHHSLPDVEAKAMVRHLTKYKVICKPRHCSMHWPAFAC